MSGGAVLLLCNYRVVHVNEEEAQIPVSVNQHPCLKTPGLVLS